jgi:flagellar biosynthesis protein FlhG
MAPEKESPKTTLTVGGGKGGTGKSFLSASLGIVLGSRGADVVIVDADLGGPNLHTLLAVRDNGRDLGDFLRNKTPQLTDVLSATSYPGVRLIRGGENALFLANLQYSRKLKLIRQLQNLPSESVIIDLGTGSAYNTLDLFILGKPGILVVTPEPTAIENTYHFLKSCAARILKLYARYFKMQERVDRMNREFEDSAGNLRDLIARLASEDRSASRILLAALQTFKPYLVVNKARNEKDHLLAQSIVNVVRRYYLIEIDLLGVIPYDERVHWSVKKFVPFVLQYPDSAVSRTIQDMAARLLPARRLEGASPSAIPRG